MSEFLGYARVSTAEQTAALQEDALRAAGCQRIWSDTASGTRTDRPQLVAVFDHLRAGDTLIVWRLDRLGRSLPHLIETIGELQARGVGFKSVQENIDTTTPGGRLVFHVFGALASFERELIQERTLAGLAAARERGRLGGRPTALSPAKLKQARKMIGEKTPVTEVAQVLGVSRATLYRRVPELGEARRPVFPSSAPAQSPSSRSKRERRPVHQRLGHAARRGTNARLGLAAREQQQRLRPTTMVLRTSTLGDELLAPLWAVLD